MNGIGGHAQPGFEPVRNAFITNLQERGEIGASVAAYVDGREVLNLWAGEARPGRPWTETTLAPVFSVSKGATALAAQVAVDRGFVELDAPIARYWPEFAAAGKGEATVRQALSHTLGLPYFPDYWKLVSFDSEEGWSKWEEITARFAQARPLWAPGTRVGYHSIAFGWLVGEIIRRATGETPGRFLQSTVCEPLGLDLWIGTPPAREYEVAVIHPDPHGAEAMAFVSDYTLESGRSMFAGPEGRPMIDMANTSTFRATEVPAVNATATARAVARMYGMLACGGTLDGVTVVSPESVREHSREQIREQDCLFGFEARLGLGYALATDSGMQFGPNDGAYGFQGLGGAIGFADPTARVGFGYVMNQMRLTGVGMVETATALCTALYGCLDEARR